MTTSPISRSPSTTRPPRPLDVPHGGWPPTSGNLTAVLYKDLKRVAHFELGRRRPWETLNTTGLVHEAYIKIAQQGTLGGWRDRGHFFAAAAQAMRHILVDAARRRLSHKHGAGQRPVALDETLLGAEARTVEHAEEVLAIDQALEQLRALDERLCRVVECRFFAGFSEAETAEALEVSERTVRRDWIRAKGWLRRWLGPGPAAASSGGANEEDHG